MRAAALALFTLTTLLGGAKPIANYQIDARLNPADKSVAGHEVLTWLNDSPTPVPELRFHLYMNAFKNSRSTFMRESGGELRRDHAVKDSWGSVDITRLAVAGEDRTRAIEFISPDDGNADDHTVIRVALREPVAPGATVTVAIDFRTVFPRVYARTGYAGDFFLGGQWFPKIGVWEKAGLRYAKVSGWNCHQFHANTEFYADFGSYDVRLTTPSNFVVGATGVEAAPVHNAGGTTTHTFHQENVHDFAWTAQPTFLRMERTFDAAREVSASELDETARRFAITANDARLSNVRVILLLQPEHVSQAERHFRAVSAAIKWFGLWYGAYPHQTITVVDPPYHAEGAGGMEYPTFITAGTSWLVAGTDRELEQVTVHEFGHQFWQGLVASNEFEEAWMDEGFNTYSTGMVMDRVYPDRALPLRAVGVPLAWVVRVPLFNSRSEDRAAYLIEPNADNLAREGWRYLDSMSYVVNSYFRTSLMLQTLENTLGPDVMARVMRAYQTRWRYGHPAFPDFIAVVNEVSGRDMQWFFDRFAYAANLADYRIGSVESKPVRAWEGWVDQGGKRTLVKQADADRADEQAEKEKKVVYRTTVTVRREGEVVFPVDVEIHFTDGSVERREWDGEYRWVKYEFDKPVKCSYAVVDPQHKLALDVNRANNSYLVEASYATTAKWTSSLLYWAEQLLATVALLA